MEFETVKTQKISETIVRQLEELILDGVLKPGEKLPPERELAQQLEVSRPSLREAIVILEAKGLLQVRRGGGTYVCDVVAQTITEPLVHLMKRRPETTFDVLELRVALEEVAAYYAAQRGNETDREILKRQFELLDKSYETYDPEKNAGADVEFHMAIADASHNVALVHVMRGLFNLMRTTIAESLNKMHNEEGNLELVRNQHRSIYNAVIAGDADRARETAHTHLAFVESTLLHLAEESAREERSLRRLRKLKDS